MGQFSVELVAAGYRVVVLTQVFPGRDNDDFHGVRIQSVQFAEFSSNIRSQVASGEYYACILVQDPLGNIIWSLEGLKPPSGTRVLIQPIINEDGYTRWKDHPDFGLRLAKILTEVGTPIVMTKNGPDTRYMQSVDIDAVYLPNATRPVLSAGDFRLQFGIEKDQFLILHVANLYWVKNHIGLIDSMQDMPKNWKMVMIGNPSGEPDCVQAVYQKLAQRPEILFIPGLSREWIAAAMQAANVVVLASKGEGSPITILEAMSHKKPWLATPECGAANDHLGGFICNLSSFKSFLQVLDNHRAWGEELGGISLAHWRLCYSWPVAMSGWIDLIELGQLRSPLVLDENLVRHMLRIRRDVTEAISVASDKGSHSNSKYNEFFTQNERLEILQPTINTNLNDLQGLDPTILVSAQNGSLDLVDIVNVAEDLVQQGKLQVAANLYYLWIENSDSYLRYAALYNLGTVLESSGEWARAQQAYRGALNLNPTFEMASVGLIRAEKKGIDTN
jgi:glycosyltransferase involved in cell wall biosynthesis